MSQPNIFLVNWVKDYGYPITTKENTKPPAHAPSDGPGSGGGATTCPVGACSGGCAARGRGGGGAMACSGGGAARGRRPRRELAGDDLGGSSRAAGLARAACARCRKQRTHRGCGRLRAVVGTSGGRSPLRWRWRWSSAPGWCSGGACRRLGGDGGRAGAPAWRRRRRTGRRSG